MKDRLPALSSPSFALISVLALVSLAALTATAFLASARLDRQANRSLGESARLEMACASAMNCAKFTLNQFSEDSWTPVATYWRGTNDTDWTNEIGYLLFGVPGSASVRWFYFPGFNPAIHKKLDTNVFVIKGTNTKPGSYLTQIGSFMDAMTTNFVTNPPSTDTNCTLIPLLGGRTSPPVGWTYIYQDKKIANSTNTTNVPVARFSYYMEDLSGLIDAERMGGSNRTIGIDASEITLTNLTTNWSSTSIINANNYSNFINPTNRAKYFSPGLMLYANSNLTTNDLRYFAHGLLSWSTFPNVIPVGIPISKSLVYAQGGNLKLNLNSLGTSASANVENIAQMITTNLTTDFLERAGGLTTNQFDYAKCLAANIVDYIDTDSTPTFGSSGITNWCGIELAPVVTCAALANARGNCTYPGVANTATTPPDFYPVTETQTATLSLQFWNPYNKATPATNVPLEFRTCPPGSESTDGLAFVIPGNTNTPIAGNGGYQHFETLFPNFKSTNINIPAIPPNSYALVEVTSTTNYTWINRSWIAGQPLPTDNTTWGMRRSANGPGQSVSTANIWIPIYRSRSGTNNNDGPHLTRGNAAISTAPWTWKYNEYYSSGDGIPVANNSWHGYIKVGPGGSFCTITNLYINTGYLSEDNANRSCWYPNLRLFAGTIGTGTLSDSTNCVGTGDPRISYFARPTNDQPLYNSSPWNTDGDGTITFDSGLSWGGRAIVRALPSTGDAVKTNRITKTSSAFRDASLATDPTTWLDSGHSDNPFGAKCIYTNNDPRDKPSASSTYASAANLFSSIPSSNWKTNQAPCHIANSPLTNICELGNIFDPIMWTRESQDIIGLKNSSNKPSVQHGGGNTLRIGRAEHPRFAFTDMGGTYPVPNMGLSAVALLDLFSVSNSYDNGGKINLNTAPAPVLRALAGGVTLTNDPSMKPSTNLVVTNKMTEAFVQGVMRYRAIYPFLSPTQLAFIATDYGNTNGAAHWTNTWPTNAVFGNTNPAILMTNAPGYSSGSPANLGVTQWNDRAAEEWFSKIYSLTSVGSCNYRTYVVAQLVDTNGLPIGRTMRKYSLMHIQYNDPGTSSSPANDSGPFISFESPY